MDDFGVPEQGTFSKNLVLLGTPNSPSFNDEHGIVNSKLRQKQELVAENRE
jgi:hypothetical protein